MPIDGQYAKNVFSVVSAAGAGEVSWEGMLATVARAMRAERLTLMSVGHGGEVYQTSWPLDPEGVLLYAREYASFDVRIPRVIASHHVGLASTLDLMSPAEVAACPVHQEFYRIYPECWNVSIFAMWSDKGVSTPSAHRSAGKGEFDPEERKFLASVAPEIARAAALRELIPAGLIARAGVLTAFDGLGDGIVIFNAAGVVVHMNTAAERLCAGKEVLALIAGTLTCPDPLSRMGLSALMSQVMMNLAEDHAAMPAPMVVRSVASDERFKVAGFASPPGMTERYGILQISRLTPPNLPSVEDIVRSTALTPAEARLCHALFSGKNLLAYAAETGLSEHTLRTHMKHIRGKLGVRNQAEALVAILRACPAG